MKAEFSSEIGSFLDGVFGPDVNFSIDLADFRAEIARLEKEIERENIEVRSFEQRITKEDMLRVRGMGITLD